METVDARLEKVESCLEKVDVSLETVDAKVEAVNVALETVNTEMELKFAQLAMTTACPETANERPLMECISSFQREEATEAEWVQQAEVCG